MKKGLEAQTKLARMRGAGTGGGIAVPCGHRSVKLMMSLILRSMQTEQRPNGSGNLGEPWHAV